MAAWRSGADSSELDVQITADGAVVILHDDTVDATTDGTGAVGAMDLAQVRRLEEGSWFAPAYAGQRIPTLGEMIEFLERHPEIDLLLEIKGSWTVEQVRLVTGPLQAAGLSERTVGQSFWPQTVAALAGAAPSLRRGLLVGDVDAEDELLAQCQQLGVATCNPARSVSASRAGRAVARGRGAGGGLDPRSARTLGRRPVLRGRCDHHQPARSPARLPGSPLIAVLELPAAELRANRSRSSATGPLLPIGDVWDRDRCPLGRIGQVATAYRDGSAPTAVEHEGCALAVP